MYPILLVSSPLATFRSTDYIVEVTWTSIHFSLLRHSLLMYDRSSDYQKDCDKIIGRISKYDLFLLGDLICWYCIWLLHMIQITGLKLNLSYPLQEPHRSIGYSEAYQSQFMLMVLFHFVWLFPPRDLILYSHGWGTPF